MVRRLIAFFMICMLALSIPACSKKTTNNTTESDINKVDSTMHLYDKPTEWTLMIQDFSNAEVNKDQIFWKEIKEKFNIDFKLEIVPSVDYTTKFNLRMASGDAPNLVNRGFGQSDTLKFFHEGIIMDLTESLKENGKDFLAEVKKDPDMFRNIKTDDGKFLGFPQIMWEYETPYSMINRAWLDDLGLGIPDTVDELYTALKAMKTLDPKILPWTRGSYYVKTHSLMHPIYYAYGTYDEWIHLKENEYVYGPYQRKDEMKEALKFLNKCYKEEIIDQEFLSVKNDDFVAKFKDGQVGFVHGWIWVPIPMEEQLNLPPEEWDWTMVPPLKGPDGNRRHPAKDLLGEAMYVTNTHPDIDKAVTFLNWFYTDEGKILQNFGVEGLTYTVENGVKKHTDMILQDTEYGAGNKLRALGFFPVRFPYVNVPEAYMALYPNREYPIKAALPYYISQKPMLAPTESEVEDIIQTSADIQAYVDEMIPKFVTGILDIDKDYDNYIKDMEKMGVQKLIDTKQVQYKRWLNR